MNNSKKKEISPTQLNYIFFVLNDFINKSYIDDMGITIDQNKEDSYTSSTQVHNYLMIVKNSISKYLAPESNGIPFKYPGHDETEYISKTSLAKIDDFINVLIRKIKNGPQEIQLEKYDKLIARMRNTFTSVLSEKQSLPLIEEIKVIADKSLTKQGYQGKIGQDSLVVAFCIYIIQKFVKLADQPKLIIDTLIKKDEYKKDNDKASDSKSEFYVTEENNNYYDGSFDVDFQFNQASQTTQQEIKIVEMVDKYLTFLRDSINSSTQYDPLLDAALNFIDNYKDNDDLKKNFSSAFNNIKSQYNHDEVENIKQSFVSLIANFKSYDDKYLFCKDGNLDNKFQELFNEKMNKLSYDNISFKIDQSSFSLLTQNKGKEY